MNCEVMHLCGYYSGSVDGELVSGILRYEKLMQDKTMLNEKGKKSPPHKRKWTTITYKTELQV
jgi:hypothetical protein